MKKIFLKLTPDIKFRLSAVTNVIKLFTSVINKCLEKASVFFPRTPLKLSLMFAS
jgi:hypothetical protein